MKRKYFRLIFVLTFSIALISTLFACGFYKHDIAEGKNMNGTIEENFDFNSQVVNLQDCINYSLLVSLLSEQALSPEEVIAKGVMLDNSGFINTKNEMENYLFRDEVRDDNKMSSFFKDFDDDFFNEYSVVVLGLFVYIDYPDIKAEDITYNNNAISVNYEVPLIVDCASEFKGYMLVFPKSVIKKDTKLIWQFTLSGQPQKTYSLIR